MKKTKILYYGDMVAATGFATVSKNILVPLYKTGKYDIEVLAINYWGEPTPLQKYFQLWPVANMGLMGGERDPYARKYVQQKILQSEFDILFMLQDTFILEFAKELLPELRYKGKKFRSILYFPIDGIPKLSWIQAMNEADYPVTYTKFGFDECTKLIPEMANKLQIIPHGANITDFHPMNYGDIVEFRKAYFGPLADNFIVTCVNRNQIRKDIPRLMMAFKKFHEKYPKSVLYVHAAVQDQGHDLVEVCKSVGLEPNMDVVFPYNFTPSRGFPIEILNRIYNASDVVVSSATGEGWGLAQTEAMSCKTPIISPDNTACTEIVGEDRGLLVKSGHDAEHKIILPHDNEVLRPIIDVNDMAEKLETMYNDEILRMRCADNGYKWVTKNLIWDKHITPLWEKVIDSAVEDLKNDVVDDTIYDGAVEV